ncbi:MAG TPA: hypothetical protein VMY98_03875 [Anaerolineae bacterium]|nr:hypothetical protein [Anaerolineae bacterium]
MTIAPKVSRGVRAVLFGATAVAALLLLLGGSDTGLGVHAGMAEPTPFTAEYYAAPSERFGVGLNTKVLVPFDATTRPARITDYRVEDLHIGWYSDWRTSADPLCPGGIKYGQLIRVKAAEYPTNTLSITETVAANPGTLWIIGNEPEAKYKQGNRTPEEYAGIYHYLYSLIKGLDSTAWIAIGGVVEPTLLRLEWLDRVLDDYEVRFGEPMPVDVWNIHVQILQEKGAAFPGDQPWGAEIPVGLEATEGRMYTLLDNADPEILKTLVIEFRQWMKAKGFQNKPLIISEYGVLMPSTYIAPDGDQITGDQLLIKFMRESFSFLLNEKDPELGYPEDENRLVQQWLWFSLNAPVNGNLFSPEDPSRITQFGSAFRGYMHVLMGLPRVMLPVTTHSYRPS